MRRAVGLVLLCAAGAAGPTRTSAAETLSFWDLKPDQLRLLVASPQVMVTRTASGWDAYCRCPVVLKPHEIPEVMKKAIIAVEDKRYLDHGGVDLIALAAVLRGGLSRGGSTIPMQLLKNLVFHDLQGRDLLSKLERKGSEVWHAGAFDGAVGKQELLAAYLNQIEFGGREIVGLYRASRHYFRKEPKDLNLYEAALLAGMVQAPARFNPLKDATREQANERARLVLGLMVQQGRISKAERLRAEQVGIRPGVLPEFKIQAQPFTEWVVQTWAPLFVKEGETIRFFVTLEPRFQRLAEKHLTDLVSEGAVPSAYEAGAVMMTADGRVRAMIGGVDWSRRQFNAAVKTSVQPGSTAKLPLLVAACEAGRGPQSRVVDLPITATWPSNGQLGYRGETTLMEAFAASRNAAAVRLTQELGVKHVAEVSRRLGIEPGPNPDAGFVLGSFSTSVMSMTAAYTTVANGGYRAAPTGVLA
uniref:transglycosylase domain-containing protein n=1 Tax=Methylobacterium nigriterrae TaxID=3127512 RepID=UPI003013D0C7